MKNPRTQTPFIIGESQLQAIDKLAKIFNIMQSETTKPTVIPRIVPTIAPTRILVIVPPPRVPEEDTPWRVLKNRTPMVTEEDPVEDSRQRDTFEHNNHHQFKQRYPTRITQLSQEINQVESKATAATRHQEQLMNIHEPVNTTPQVI